MGRIAQEAEASLIAHNEDAERPEAPEAEQHVPTTNEEEPATQEQEVVPFDATQEVKNMREKLVEFTQQLAQMISDEVSVEDATLLREKIGVPNMKFKNKPLRSAIKNHRELIVGNPDKPTLGEEGMKAILTNAHKELRTFGVNMAKDLPSLQSVDHEEIDRRHRELESAMRRTGKTDTIQNIMIEVLMKAPYYAKGATPPNQAFRYH